MTIGRYQFRPMTDADLPLIKRWLVAPHVARWWGDAGAALKEIRSALAEPSTHPYIVEIDGHPAGYIQSYDIHAEPAHPYQDQPLGTVGFDLTIGDERMLGCGHGPKLIEVFVGRLFMAGAPRVVVDPAPDNARAIRAYEKALFRAFDRRDSSEFGPALLMVREAPGQAAAA